MKYICVINHFLIPMNYKIIKKENELSFNIENDTNDCVTINSIAFKFDKMIRPTIRI